MQTQKVINSKFSVGVFLVPLLLAGCSVSRKTENRDNFLASGTTVLSRNVPAENEAGEMAPLIGFFPTYGAFLPAENEPWLSIAPATKQVNLMVGTKAVREYRAVGNVGVPQGSYLLARKDQNPRWYAPDTYFRRRHLQVPPPADPNRYRRGALGELALFPTDTFSIHSAMIPSEDVGGLRLQPEELRSIFESLPLGAPIVVR